MCDSCGCAAGTDHFRVAGSVVRPAESGEVKVLRAMLHENDYQARHNRAHFDAAHVLAVNLMSSPGAGKTSLLEATIRALKARLSVAVIEGDLETENDARRIRAAGAPGTATAGGLSSDGHCACQPGNHRRPARCQAHSTTTASASA